MPNEESLRISYASNVAGLVEKDAAALEKLGDVAEVTERKITKPAAQSLAMPENLMMSRRPPMRFSAL